MSDAPRCRTCQIRVSAAGDRCAHCWRDRANYLEALLLRTHHQILGLGRHINEDMDALIQEARQTATPDSTTHYVPLPLTSMDIIKGGSARV